MCNHCIYCNSAGPFSDEHPIPAGLGEFEGFPRLKNRICKSCNGEIGKAEDQFCHCGPEAFFREYLGIEGRSSHRKINPFLRGSAGGSPIDFTAVDPVSGLNLLYEFNPGGRAVREVRQIVLIDESGISHPLRISPWMSTSEELRDAIRRMQIGRIVSARVFADQEEVEQVERLVRPLGRDFTWNEPLPATTITGSVARFGVSTPYFRAIAKIGFHYMLSVCTSVRGNEAGFASIREFIKQGGDDAQFVRQERDLLTGFEREGQIHLPNGFVHVAISEWDEGRITTKLQFFLGPGYIPWVYVVKIANGVDGFLGSGRIGHCFQYYPDGPHGRFAGVVCPVIEPP